jgi:hypothetical protein
MISGSQMSFQSKAAHDASSLWNDRLTGSSSGHFAIFDSMLTVRASINLIPTPEFRPRSFPVSTFPGLASSNRRSQSAVHAPFTLICCPFTLIHVHPRLSTLFHAISEGGPPPRIFEVVSGFTVASLVQKPFTSALPTPGSQIRHPSSFPFIPPGIGSIRVHWCLFVVQLRSLPRQRHAH